MITEKRIGVLAGGISAERDVSLRSGDAVYKALIGRGYNAVLIDPSAGLCETLKKEQVGMAFIALHGGYGENGAVQGLLEVLGIPYTGSGVLSSALAMDKEVSKQMFLGHGVPTPPSMVVTAGELSGPSIESKGKSLAGHLMSVISFEMPWVIKPVNEGSSIGVNIIKAEEGLAEAVKVALGYGEKIMVEKYIKGREIQIGILGQKALGGVEVRPKLDFYNYEAKYTAGMTEYILPPDVETTVYERLKAAALAAHNALGCKGATRVDLILDGSENVFVLEVNTIPGMTETSLLPKIAGLAGLEFPELVEEMLKSAG